MTLLTDEQIREEQRKHQLDSAVQIRGIEVGTHAQLAEVIKDLRQRAAPVSDYGYKDEYQRALDGIADEYQGELDEKEI